MIPRVQPTNTSCGPTALAMLLDVDPENIIQRVHDARTPARQRIKNERSNVGELARAAASLGYAMSTRHRYERVPEHGLFLLRFEAKPGSNWHWMACRDGSICNPATGETCPLEKLYTVEGLSAMVSWYALVPSPSVTP